jgi:hypothetical protein
MAKVRAIEKATVEDVAATGVTITIENQGSETWKRSAELAVEIANSVEFQLLTYGLLKSVAEGSDVMEIADQIDEKSDYVRGKYGKRQFFDSGVAQAANFTATMILRRGMAF